MIEYFLASPLCEKRRHSLRIIKAPLSVILCSLYLLGKISFFSLKEMTKGVVLMQHH